MNTDEREWIFKSKKMLLCKGYLYPLFLSALICVNLWLFTSCQKSPPTDLRAFAPAETLVYLEANDLGATLESLTRKQAYKELAAAAPDFSRLENIQIALVVTGFETSEKQVTGEQSILNFKPRFALIADTHQWESTALTVVETQIGKFAAGIYGGDAKLEKRQKNGAPFFTWTATDGRKLFAAVAGGLIYAGNDETLLEKCLAVKKGEAENLLKNENLARAREAVGRNENLLGFGYVAPEAVAQIADVIGVTMALRADEDDPARGFVAKNLPPVLRKSVNEIVWTTRATEGGIEDRYSIKTGVEISSVWKETLVPAENDFSAAQFVPQNFESATRYNLQNPQIAWRSVLLVVSKQLDAPGANVLAQVSGAFFAPYGVADAETFLSAVGSQIVTVALDEEGDKTVVIADFRDTEKLKKSLAQEINFKTAPEKIGRAEVWKSEDGALAAAFSEGHLILGERAGVLQCLEAQETGRNFAKTVQFSRFVQNKAAATTVFKDAETAQKIVRLLGTLPDERKRFVGFYQTETRFTESGIERRTISDFGFLGTILEQFGGEN